MRRRHWICVFAALPLAACTAAPEPAPTDTNSARPAPALRLVAFDSCQELLSDLRTAAKESVGPWGLPGSSGIPEAAMKTDSRLAAPAAGMAPPPAVPDHSTTNVHEKGADEPDVVKTDGRRIVTVEGGVLRVIDPATHAQTGRLDLGAGAGGEADLLLSGDRALVLVRGGGYAVADKRALLPEGGNPQVVLVDLAGPPRVLSRYRGEGTVVDARQTGTVARVVLATAPKLRFPLTATGESQLLRQNRKVIDDATVDAWLPTWELTTGSGTTEGKLDCSAISRPAAYSGAAMLHVLTFDLAAPALTDGSPVSVLADGNLVYGTADSLYVANNQFWRAAATTRVRPPENTEIFKFTLPAAGKPVYSAGGTVPGTILNQYAMSEWDGHLRVATTDPDGNASTVRVFRERNGKLTQVGEVGGLGKNERIYSVRFIGARGYVVTFRQTDPLYSLDLADPEKPRVTGELKITGYSAHLQAIGADRLVGIGQEATERGRPVGLQVSLFDVSDPADPRRLAHHVVPGASSEAEFDPHAVLWWPATGLLVVPVAGAQGGGALALRLTGDTLTATGELEVPGDRFSPVRRSLVVGNELWTLSYSGLLATNLSTLDRTGWVPLR
jgi:uncharacterized secreted protein with C-terminal beta-propeller domain